MPTHVYDTPGTHVTDTVPPGGSEFITFKAWAPGGGAVDGSNAVAGGSRAYDSAGDFGDSWPAGIETGYVEVFGPGGDGADGDGTGGGGAGGGGGYTKKTIANPTGAYSGHVGAGGSGTDSTFTDGAATLTGGAGADGTGSTGGAGGGGAGGDTNRNGGNGGNGSTSGNTGGGGGGGASGESSQNGDTGGNGSGTTGGAPGLNAGDGADGGKGGDGSGGTAANPGGAGGGGGGGGSGSSGSHPTGAAGGTGAVVVSWDAVSGHGGGAGGSGCYVEVEIEVPSGERCIIEIPNRGASGATAGLEADPISIGITTGGSGFTEILRATGGRGGTSSIGGAGGDEADCIGEIKRSGSRGGDGDGGGGGGGGSPGDGSSGTDGDGASGDFGGTGGTGGATGGAAGGNGGDAMADGQPGSNPGAGGGGGGRDGGLGKDGGEGRVEMSWVPDDKWFSTDCFCCDSTLWDTCSGEQDWIDFDALAISQDGTHVFAETPNGWVAHEPYMFDATEWGLTDDLTVDLAWIWEAVWERPSGQTCTIKLGMFCDRRGDCDPQVPNFGIGAWHFLMTQASFLPCGGTYQLNGAGYGPESIGEEFWPCAFTREVGVAPDGSFAVFIEHHPTVPGPPAFSEGHNITILGLVPECP